MDPDKSFMIGSNHLPQTLLIVLPLMPTVPLFFSAWQTSSNLSEWPYPVFTAPLAMICHFLAILVYGFNMHNCCKMQLKVFFIC